MFQTITSLQRGLYGVSMCLYGVSICLYGVKPSLYKTIVFIDVVYGNFNTFMGMFVEYEFEWNVSGISWFTK